MDFDKIQKKLVKIEISNLRRFFLQTEKLVFSKKLKKRTRNGIIGNYHISTYDDFFPCRIHGFVQKNKIGKAIIVYRTYDDIFTSAFRGAVDVKAEAPTIERYCRLLLEAQFSGKEHLIWARDVISCFLANRKFSEKIEIVKLEDDGGGVFIFGNSEYCCDNGYQLIMAIAECHQQLY